MGTRKNPKEDIMQAYKYKLNLQLFGEEGENVEEIAEPQEETELEIDEQAEPSGRNSGSRCP
jgi:hypothetical protein